MRQPLSWFLLSLTVVSLAFAQQYPVMDKVANKVIEKYQTASCEQLRQQSQQAKSKPPSVAEQHVIQAMQRDAQMREAFFNKVAPPIVNKMFECHMIP